MAEQSPGEKIHEPTPKKLEDARKKGDVPKSTDLATAASYGGLLLAILAAGAGSIGSFASYSITLMENADALSSAFLADVGATGKPLELLVRPTLSLAPLFLFPMVAVLLAYIAQRGVVFAPEKIQPKLNRISLLEGFKNKFGADGFFNFVKSTLKLTVISIILGMYIVWRLPDLISALAYEPQMVTLQMGRLCLEFLSLATLVIGVIGVGDALWQYASYMRRNRMSDQDIKDEAKDSEGDPHLKQARRQRAQERANSQMMADVPDATVVIVNPTHFAVALKWARTDLGAPTCVAKGQDEVALKIREIAQEAGVPIHSDPPTARALYATVEVGEIIDPEFYAPVAAAIRFAETVQDKRRRSW